MNRERIKELAMYWYFRFPKPMWAAVAVILFVVVNIAIALWFPPLFDNGEPVSWGGRMMSFYLVLSIACLAGMIGGWALVPFIRFLYSLLPDDPRKAKGEEE